MIQSFTYRFIMTVFGVMVGAYLPLAIFYLVCFFRREHLGFVLFWRTLVRLGGIVLLFFLILAAFGLPLAFLEPAQTELNAIDDLLLGFGAIGGFLGGIILFVIGLRRGRRQKSIN
jgi:hypothetical protein